MPVDLSVNDKYTIKLEVDFLVNEVFKQRWICYPSFNLSSFSGQFMNIAHRSVPDPWRVTGRAGVAFLHRAMCLCSGCLVPPMCISVLFVLWVDQSLPTKKLKWNLLLDRKLIFLLCPPSVKQLKLWSGGLGRSIAALKSEVSNWLVNTFFYHFCHSVPATGVLH